MGTMTAAETTYLERLEAVAEYTAAHNLRPAADGTVRDQDTGAEATVAAAVHIYPSVAGPRRRLYSALGHRDICT